MPQKNRRCLFGAVIGQPGPPAYSRRVSYQRSRDAHETFFLIKKSKSVNFADSFCRPAPRAVAGRPRLARQFAIVL